MVDRTTRYFDWAILNSYVSQYQRVEVIEMENPPVVDLHSRGSQTYFVHVESFLLEGFPACDV